jgi:hypothetical protein
VRCAVHVMQTLSRGKGGQGGNLLLMVTACYKCFAGEADRLDKVQTVASGLFDISIDAVREFEARGVAGVEDTDYFGIYRALDVIKTCMDQPGCEAKVRGVASGLAFCLDHNLESAGDMGLSSGANAAMVCASCFGRDEGESQFSFAQKHVDDL